MLYRSFQTDIENSAYMFTRVVLAAVIFPHGAQKLWGVFGGYGFDGTMHYFTETVGLPWFLGFLVILGETLGALLLLAGLLSRFAAASLGVIMIGVAAQHAGNGFFMNWFGNQAGEGIEFFILAMAMAGIVTIYGGGKWSLDGWLITRRQRNRTQLRQKLETTV